MTLAKQLQEQKERIRCEFPDHFPTLVDGAVLEFQQYKFNSLRTGDRMPTFTLPNQNREMVNVASLLSQGPLVVSFYRGTWCPFCQLELNAYVQVLPAITALGANLIGISPQRSRPGQTPPPEGITLLWDKRNQIARQLGLVIQVPKYLDQALQEIGHNIREVNEDESVELPIPATYVVEPDGKIIYDFVDVDFTRRADPVEIVTVLRRITV